MKFSELFIYTLGLVFTPHLLYHLDVFTSLSYGLILICILMIFISTKKNINLNKLNFEKVFLILIIILLLNLPSIIIFSEFNLKYLYSILGVFIMLFGTLLYAENLKKNAKNITKLIILITYIISLLAILERLGLFQIKLEIKAIFPFNEPSHYALSLAPFLLSLMFINTRIIYKIIPLLINLYIGFAVQNLTLMVILLMCFLVFLIRNKNSLILIIFLLFAIVFINEDFFISYAEYVYDRINFNSDSKNTTALVYMQGYHLIFEVMEKTYGIGLGFNSLGDFSPNNYYSNRLYSINGSYSNINDGGILISKLVCEFGLIGIIATIYYIYILIKNFKKFTSCSQGPCQAISFGFILSGLIDFFIRSTGYFTPSVFFLMVGIFLLYRKKNEADNKN